MSDAWLMAVSHIPTDLNDAVANLPVAVFAFELDSYSQIL